MSIKKRPKAKLAKPNFYISRLRKASSFSKANLAIFVLLFGAIGAYALFQGSAAGTTANLWIDTNGGTCTRQAAAGAYVDAQACSSMQTALVACTAGDTIIMKAGTYGSQSISASKTSPGCSITAEGGTTTGAISAGGAWYTLADITVDTGSTHGPGGLATSGNNLTFDNVNLHGQYVSALFNGGTNITWKGGELGASGVTGGQRSCLSDTEPVEVRTNHVTIDGVTLWPQDHTRVAESCSSNGYHLEMVRCDTGCAFLTIKNSIWADGDHSDTSSIFITDNAAGSQSSDAHDITIQNNYFGSADNGAWDVHTQIPTCLNMTFAYNTLHNSPDFALQCTTFTNVQIIGNLGPRPSYYSCNGTHTKNVWQDSLSYSCGSDKVINGTRFGYDALGMGGAGGFHLVAGSPAINSGEAAGYCTGSLGSLDIDGDTRSSPCDAGADEFSSGGGGGTPKIGDLNNDNSVNILDLSILLSHYAQSATASQGDINLDGTVTITDLSILLSKWGT